MFLFILGLALVATGGTSLAGTLSFLDRCTDECQGAAISGALGLLLFSAGVGALIAAAIGFVREREGREVASRDRRLRELESRLLRG